MQKQESNTRFVLIVGEYSRAIQLWSNKLMQTYGADTVVLKDASKEEGIDYTLPERGHRIAYSVYNTAKDQVNEKDISRFLSALKLPDAPQVLLLMHVSSVQDFPPGLISQLNSVHVFPFQGMFDRGNILYLDSISNAIMPDNELDTRDLLAFCNIDGRVLTIPFQTPQQLPRIN